MKNKKNNLMKLLMTVFLALLTLPIVSILAVTPADLTGQSDYLVIHNTTDSYDATGGPSSIEVKDADDNAITPVGGTYSDVPADATISLEYVFHLEDGDGQGELYTYSGSNYFTISLPEGIDFAYTAGQTHDIIAEDATTGQWTLGTWQFTDSNTIRVDFSDDVATHSNMWGKIGVDGTFKELGPDDGTSTEVTFGTQVITIEREVPPLPEIELEKSGVYNASTNDITWTVTVMPPDGTNLDDYTLVDAYSSNQFYKSGTFSVGTDSIADTSLDLTTSHQVSYTFPADTTGVQTITYKTTPTTYSSETGAGNSSTESSTFSNTATIYWGDEATSDPAQATVTTDWISKDGNKESTSDGSLVIKWTVNVTIPGDEAVTGAAITDTLPAGLELLENNTTYPVQVNINSGGATTVSEGIGAGTYSYTYTGTSTASTLEYRFPSSLSGSATLIYYTKVTNRDSMLNSNNLVNFTNGAKLSWTEMSDSAHPPGDTKTVKGVDGGGLLSKSGGGISDFVYPGYIQWTVTVNKNDISMTNAIIQDTIPANQKLLIDAGHPFTVKQDSNPVFTATSAAATTEFTSTDNDFSYALGNITGTYTVTYYTEIVDFSTLYVNYDSVKFSNKVVLKRDGETDVSVNPAKTYRSQMIAKSVAESYDYATHTMKWQIVVNRNQLPLTNGEVTDTLPTGMVLLIDNDHPFTVLENGETTPLATAPTSGADGDTAFTYKFLSPIDNQYVITFYTLLTDDTLKDQWSGTKDFTNNATLDGDEITTAITASATAKIKNPIVSKTYDYETGSDFIDWSAVINPGQIALVNASVTDVLNEGLMLDEDSVKLYQVDVNADGSVKAAADGTLVSFGDYIVTMPTADNGNTLTVTLPNSSDAYRLEFTTYIIVDDLDMVNEISLTGSSGSPSGTAESSQIEINDLWSSGGSGSMSLTVNKLDGENEPVEGAVYRLLNINKEPIVKNGNYIEATTNADGDAIFSNLPTWVFYVVEVDAPDGYLLSPTYLGGDRLDENTTYNTTDDTALGTLSFDKEATDEAILSGGTFTLTGTDYDDHTVSRTASAVDGVVTFSDLPIGTYSVTETTAPDGYVESSDTITATVGYNEDETEVVVTITSENDSLVNRPLPTATVEFNKTDGIDPLPGAAFTMYNQDSEEVATATSDEYGLVSFTEIPAGTYTVLETASPIGYLISDTEITVDITYNQDKTECIVELSPDEDIVDEPIAPTTIEFTKTNGENPLAGAVFGLYDSDNTLLQSATSGIDGLVRFTGVGVGTYTIRETQAPKDYLLNETEITAVVTYNEENTGMDVALTPDGDFVNEIDPTTQIATVELKKTDDAGAALAGAVFGLYNSNNELVSQATSGADGKVIFADVLIGTYTIKEISAPAGYQISSIKIPVKLTKDDVDTVVQTTPNTIVDNRIGATIQIKKVDSSTGKVLSGAVFSLVNESGTIVATATSGSNGLATFSNVMPGNYTITETKAPSGYIASTDTIKVTAMLDQTYTYTVKNTAKNTLPQSGMFWDGKMLALAGVFLILIGGTIGLLNRRRGTKKI